MPLDIRSEAPTMLIRRAAFERSGLTRADLDTALNLTPDEFRVEGGMIAVGPLHGEKAIGGLTEQLESLGLQYFEDFFELPGNWPDWMRLLVTAAR